MQHPTQQTELPAGVIRSSFGAKVVMLVDSKMPFAKNTEILKLADAMPFEERPFRYWVFSMPKEVLEKNDRTLTISLPNSNVVKSFGYNTYDAAEERYVELSNTENGKDITVRGLGFVESKKLGKED